MSGECEELEMKLTSTDDWTLEELEKLEQFCDSIGKPDTFNVDTTVFESTCISDVLYYKKQGWIETYGPNSKPFELGE